MVGYKKGVRILESSALKNPAALLSQSNVVSKYGESVCKVVSGEINHATIPPNWVGGDNSHFAIVI